MVKPMHVMLMVIGLAVSMVEVNGDFEVCAYPAYFVFAHALRPRARRCIPVEKEVPWGQQRKLL